MSSKGPYVAIKLAMSKIGGQFSQPSEVKKVYKQDGGGSLADHAHHITTWYPPRQNPNTSPGNGDVKNCCLEF